MKPFKSDTNFTGQFFEEGSEFEPITELFDFPGFKIASGPIEVEFMLQD